VIVFIRLAPHMQAPACEGLAQCIFAFNVKVSIFCLKTSHRLTEPSEVICEHANIRVSKQKNTSDHCVKCIF